MYLFNVHFCGKWMDLINILQCWNKLYIMNSWWLLHCCLHPLSNDFRLLLPSHNHRLRVVRVGLPEGGKENGRMIRWQSQICILLSSSLSKEYTQVLKMCTLNPDDELPLVCWLQSVMDWVTSWSTCENNSIIVSQRSTTKHFFVNFNSNQ